MSNPSQPEPGEAKYETVTAQYWPYDLSQLRQLVEAGKNRDTIGQLRRLAMHIGVLMLSLSARALLSGEDRIGIYTAKEIAEELLPLIDPAIQTLARLGYPVHPYPVGITTLLEMMARLASTPAVLEATQQALHTEERTGARLDTLLSEESGEHAGGERLLPTKETRERLKLDDEGTV
jgi:hypothetical protein